VLLGRYKQERDEAVSSQTKLKREVHASVGMREKAGPDTGMADRIDGGQTRQRAVERVAGREGGISGDRASEVSSCVQCSCFVVLVEGLPCMSWGREVNR